MPHAESDNNSTMGSTVNGEKPGSAFIAHLGEYPVVNDTISTFKSNPYGQRSLSLADSGYQTIVSPVLPYFSKPYQYVSPYITRADTLGDSTLSRVDARFPVVKKPTGELYEDAHQLALLPYNKSIEGRDYVLSTYNSEYKKVGGEGLVTYGKAAVTTSLILSSDALSWLSNYLSAKKEQSKEIINEKINN